MNILSFYKKFPDEDACIRHLKEQREQAGMSVRNAAVHITTGNLIEISGSANNVVTGPG